MPNFSQAILPPSKSILERTILEWSLRNFYVLEEDIRAGDFSAFVGNIFDCKYQHLSHQTAEHLLKKVCRTFHKVSPELITTTDIELIAFYDKEAGNIMRNPARGGGGRVILLHEIAHALTEKGGHNRVWLNKFIALLSQYLRWNKDDLRSLAYQFGLGA